MEAVGAWWSSFLIDADTVFRYDPVMLPASRISRPSSRDHQLVNGCGTGPAGERLPATLFLVEFFRQGADFISNSIGTLPQ